MSESEYLADNTNMKIIIITLALGKIKLCHAVLKGN